MSDPLFCSRCFSSRFASRLRKWPKMRGFHKPGFNERQGATRAHDILVDGLERKQRRDGGHSAEVRVRVACSVATFGNCRGWQVV